MKTLRECCNGCGKPPCPPSKVLCRECLHGLDRKMHAICKPPVTPKAPEEVPYCPQDAGKSDLPRCSGVGVPCADPVCERKTHTIPQAPEGET